MLADGNFVQFRGAMPADGNSVQDVDCDYECCVCGAEEEIATIHLDASGVVFPPADEAGEAETQHVAYFFFTLILYAVGLYHLLAPGPYQRLQYVRSIIKAEAIEPRFGMALIIGVVIVLISVWKRRFERCLTSMSKK